MPKDRGLMEGKCERFWKYSALTWKSAIHCGGGRGRDHMHGYPNGKLKSKEGGYKCMEREGKSTQEKGARAHKEGGCKGIEGEGKRTKEGVQAHEGEGRDGRLISKVAKMHKWLEAHHIRMGRTSLSLQSNAS